MTQNRKREVRTLKKFATDPTGDQVAVSDAPYRSERHRKLIFEREETKRKASYELLINKLMLMVENRSAAEVRDLDKTRKSDTTIFDEALDSGEQSSSTESNKQHQVCVPNRVRPGSRVATVK